MNHWLHAIQRHQIPTWAGFVFGIVAIVSPFQSMLPQRLSVGIMVVGWLLTLTLGSGLVLLLRSLREHPVRCLNCKKKYELSGTRGKNTTAVETLELKVVFPTDSLLLWVLSSSGELSDTKIEFRNRGKRGESVMDKWHDLTDSAHEDFVEGQNRHQRLSLPAPAKRGEILQVRSTRNYKDTFELKNEGVGKNVLFPIDRLEFELLFDGCDITNCNGRRLIGNLPRKFKILTPTVEADGKKLLKWTVMGGNPGERLRVSWTWVDAAVLGC